MNILPATPEERRRQYVALTALIVIAGGAYWYLGGTGTPAATQGQSAAERIQASGSLPVPEPIRFAALDDVPAPSEAGRNPFAFGVRPPPPPPPMPRVVAQPTLEPPPVVLPPAPTGPPPIGLKLAGITQPVANGRMLVTLLDPLTRAVYLAYEGDVVDGKYKVVKVGLQSVVLSYVDGTGQRTVPLGVRDGRAQGLTRSNRPSWPAGHPSSSISEIL